MPRINNIRLALPLSILLPVAWIGIGTISCSRSGRPSPDKVAPSSTPEKTLPPSLPSKISEANDIFHPVQSPSTAQANAPLKASPATLKRLEAEKTAYIENLLQDLRSDRKISMADFLIRSETIEQNLYSLRSGSGKLVDEKNVRARYQILLKQGRSLVIKAEGDERKIEALYAYLHFYVFRTYHKKSSGMLAVMKRGTYNCTSATKTMLALEEDLIGSKRYGFIILDPPRGGSEGHMRSWLRDDKGNVWQIENTAYSQKIPFRSGLKLPGEMMVAAYLLGNGIKMEQLPARLSQFYTRRARIGYGGQGPSGRPSGVSELFLVAGESHDLPPLPDKPKFNKNFRKIFKENGRIPPPPPPPRVRKGVCNGKVDREVVDACNAKCGPIKEPMAQAKCIAKFK